MLFQLQGLSGRLLSKSLSYVYHVSGKGRLVLRSNAPLGLQLILNPLLHGGSFPRALRFDNLAGVAEKVCPGFMGGWDLQRFYG